MTSSILLWTLLLVGDFVCNTEALRCIQCFYSSKDLIANQPEVMDCLNNPNKTIGNELTLPENLKKYNKYALTIEAALPNCNYSSSPSCARYVGTADEWGRVLYRTCGTTVDKIGYHNLTPSEGQVFRLSFLKFRTLKKCVCNERDHCNDLTGFDGDDYNYQKNESTRKRHPGHFLIFMQYYFLILCIIFFVSENHLQYY